MSQPGQVLLPPGRSDSCFFDWRLVVESNNFEAVAIRKSSVGRKVSWSPNWIGNCAPITILSSVPSTEFITGTGLANSVKPPPS